MKRLAVLAALAALLSSVGLATTGAAADDSVYITVTDVYTSDYPSDPNPITVCLNGENPQVMEAGDQYFIEGFPGVFTFTVFDSDAAACSDVPEQTYATSVYAGDRIGLVVGPNLMYTFDYDDSCVPEGQARVLVASGLFIGTDVYLYSEGDGQATPFASGLIGGSSTSEIAAGTYDVVVVNEDGDPYGPRLATVPGVDFAEGTYTQVFLVGGSPDQTGGFTEQQGPLVCDDAEPPPTATSSTTSSTTAPSTSTTSTSTTAAVAPVSVDPATPATPVSGNATFTG